MKKVICSGCLEVPAIAEFETPKGKKCLCKTCAERNNKVMEDLREAEIETEETVDGADYDYEDEPEVVEKPIYASTKKQKFKEPEPVEIKGPPIEAEIKTPMSIREFLSMKRPGEGTPYHTKVRQELETLRNQQRRALKSLRQYMEWSVKEGKCFATHLEIEIPCVVWTEGKR